MINITAEQKSTKSDKSHKIIKQFASSNGTKIKSRSILCTVKIYNVKKPKRASTIDVNNNLSLYDVSSA